MTDIAARHDELRPLMFSIAYRMLGQVSEAEDVVQDAWLRMQTDDTVVRSAEACASTVTTRLAIDHLRSARVRREAYVGLWLPEPLLTMTSDADPAVRAETADTLSVAFLVLLESLPRSSRPCSCSGEALIRLRPHRRHRREVGGQLPADLRQRALAHRRAAAAVRGLVGQRDVLARRFFAACEQDDLAGLERLLSADVVFHGDSGGKAPGYGTQLKDTSRCSASWARCCGRARRRVPGWSRWR